MSFQVLNLRQQHLNMSAQILLLPSQCLEETSVSEGTEGKIWQDGQQVCQQSTVGRHEVRSYHNNGVQCCGHFLLGVWGSHGAVDVCVTLTCKTAMKTERLHR